MKIKLLLILMFCTSCSSSDGLVDISGTWVIASVVEHGKVEDVSKVADILILVDETTWITRESGRDKLFYYFTTISEGQTQLKVCRDKACDDIEVLGLVRMKDGMMEICMADYSKGDDYPKTFESTKENKLALVKFKRVKNE